jgi:acetate---CoA ligase (ADP-forming)
MRSITGAEEDVARLFHPRSVAVVGASSRPGTLSWWPLHLLQLYDYDGLIFPVNPNRDEIDGVRCFPTLASIDQPVDVAIVALNAENSATAVRECASLGVRSVILPSQGFGELGETGRALEREMLELARAAQMRIVGPNTDGVANLSTGAVMSIQPLFGEQMPLGEVAVITQSGASAGSLMSRLKREGIGCRFYASAGNEIDLGLADYLSVALQDENVRMVLSFVEAIRKPGDFVGVSQLARELGKPMVLIKVGRTTQAAQRAAAHTGALAGADRIYESLFKSLGIIRVNELSEVVAVARYFLSNGVPRSRGVGVMSVSGGQAGALADLAVGMGLDIPPINDDTSRALRELLPFGSPLNPCDLTGEIATRETLAADVFGALASDPSIDTVIYARKELTGQAGRRAAAELVKTAADSDASLAVYAMDGQMNDDEIASYSLAKIPVFNSASELFLAIRALGSSVTDVTSKRESGGAATPKAFDTGTSGVLEHGATNALLQEYGIHVVAEGVAGSASHAIELANEFGYPVALKVVSEKISHKTEIGGVLLGVMSDEAVMAGYDLLTERGRRALDVDDIEGILVQQQVDDSVEMIAGLVVDEQFGPFVLVGSGGILAELLDDVSLRPAPVSQEQALEMINELRGSVLLNGYRGGESRDVDSLARTVSALSQLGADYASVLAEVDLNPVLVRSDGLGAVVPDALVVASNRADRE